MDNFTQELISILSGGISLATYTAALIIAIIGFLAMAIINYMQRTDKDKLFSVVFWFKKNGAFLLLLIIAVYSFLRFQEDLIVAITEKTGNGFSFVKDRFLWFLIGGFIFRIIVHQGNKIIRKFND